MSIHRANACPGEFRRPLALARAGGRWKGSLAALGLRLAALGLWSALCILSGCASLGGTAPSGEVARGQSPGGPFGESLPAPKSDEPGLLANLWKKAKTYVGPQPDEAKGRDAFRRGDALFEEKKFDEAVVEYKRAAALAPDSPVEEDALFMIGESYFFADKYPTASQSYGELVRKYPNSRHLDRAAARWFAIGRYWQELDKAQPRHPLNPNFLDKTRPMWNTKNNAVAAFRAIWLHDPTGPLADDAVIQIANTYFQNGDYLEADEFYSQYRRDYPTEKHVMYAYLLGYRAKLARYQGPKYDPRPLDEAEELIEALLTQFSDQLGEDLAKVRQAKALVHAMQAERQYYLGQFFEGKGHYYAARQYYQRTIQKYHQTKFAELARQRLGEVEKHPLDQEERFAWLDDFLPQDKTLPKPIVAQEQKTTELR